MAMPVLVNASKEYSRLRLISSAGAGAGAIVFGVLYAFAGYSAAPLVFAGIMVFTIACAQFVPLGRDRECRRRASAKREGRTHAAPGQGRFGSIGEAFKIRPRLAAVLVSMVFVFIGIMASGTYISLRISDLGGGAVEIGMANGIGSAAEIPGLILAGFLVASFRCPAGFSRLVSVPGRVLAASSVGFAACLLIWVFLVDAAPILISRFISGIFFAGVFVSYVLTIFQMLSIGLQSTGQTLLQAA